MPDDDEARTRSDARFRDLVEGAPDGVVISRDGIVLYANASAMRLLGYGEGHELVGQPMSVFLDAESIGTMRKRLQAMRETGVQPAPYEYEARRRDGSGVTAEITSLFIEHDGAPAVLAFARDVTERVRLRAQVAHADRLAALGLMAAGVAHEISNPLVFVRLGTEMLERRLRSPLDANTVAELMKTVNEIRVGVDRIAIIARELRVYARFEEEPAGIVDLIQVLESSERLVAHEVAGRARLRREIPELPAVRGVATRLEQVFVNLILNAAFAIGDDRADGEIVVRAAPRERDVYVSVEDNGEGIAPEVIGRIFEPFFTTRPARAGTGLGLSICRDIVTRLGGTIGAKSDVARGTTIELTLPRADFEETKSGR